jgi:purine-binding chemotaxis protein CheW
MGLKADRVFEVTVLDETELDPAPQAAGSWSGHCIAGIGRRGGKFVTVLDLDRLLGTVRLDGPNEGRPHKPILA